jgi:hypothetical protein
LTSQLLLLRAGREEVGHVAQVVREEAAGVEVLVGCQLCCCLQQGAAASVAGEGAKGLGEEGGVGVLH